MPLTHVEEKTCKAIREDASRLCEIKHEHIRCQIAAMALDHKDVELEVKGLTLLVERTVAVQEMLAKAKCKEAEGEKFWQTRAFERLVTVGSIVVVLSLLSIIGARLMEILPVLDRVLNTLP